MEDQRVTGMDEKFFTEKLCCICKKFLSIPPIYMTRPDGTEFKCGRCSSIETEFSLPAILFEREASHRSFPCIFTNCVEKIPWIDMKKHEDTCIHQPFLCPCGTIMEIEGVRDHFTGHHPQEIFENKLVFKHFKQRLDNTIFSRIILKDNMPFLVHLVCVLDTSNVEIKVYSFFNTSKNYQYKIQVTMNMENIILKNQPIIRYNSQKHSCLDCLLDTCQFYRHLNQDSSSNPLPKPKFPIPYSETFVLTVAVSEEDDSSVVEHMAGLARNDQLRHSWECDVCQEYMTIRVYMCPTGHSVCKMCRGKIELCPFCKLKMGYTRNRTLEALKETVPVTCKNEARGCWFVGDIHAMVDHERECDMAEGPEIKETN